jgi:glutamyl endopeptidase
VHYLPSSFSVVTEDLSAESFGVREATSISSNTHAEGIMAMPMHVVKARNRVPWTAIVPFPGTAFFIAPRVLITAGHCLYTQEEGWVEEFQIKTGDNEPINVSSLRVTFEWASRLDLDYDVGAILLDSPLPNEGHFGLGVLETSIIDSALVHCAGFPFSQQPPTNNGSRTFTHGAGKVASLERKIKYDFYGGGGASGSPVWVQTAAGHRIVIAIHHRTGQEKERSQNIRYGVRVTDKLFQCMKSWIQEAERNDAAARPNPVLRAIGPSMLTSRSPE